MRVCVIPAGTGGVAFYRIFQPYGWLQEQGKEIFIFNQELHDSHRLNMEQMAADVIVYQCPWSEGILQAIKLIKSGEKFGYAKKAVVEFDDNLFNVSPWNEKYNMFGIREIKITYNDKQAQDTILSKIHETPWARREWSPEGGLTFDMWRDGYGGLDLKENIKRYEATSEICKIVDLVTVTTADLGKQLREHRPVGDIAVLPNLIDFDRWLPMEKNESDTIRIGWQGGSAHFEDLHSISQELISLSKKYPQIRYVFMGQPYPSIFNEIADKVEWHGWHGDIATYPLVVRELKLDIGLCPLVDNTFNWGKSAIKWFEYSAMGIPAVVSPVVYSRVVDHKKTAFIANPGEWSHYIEKLINNKSLRKTIAKKAYEEVRSKYHVGKAKLWWQSLENLVKKPMLLAA